MLSVSVLFICPCCQAPGDPISIFSIPGDYIAMLGCRIGTKHMRTFLLPMLSMLLTPPPPAPNSHHITHCRLVLLLAPVAMLALLPRAPASSISQCPLSRLRLNSASFRPRLPSALACVGSRGSAIAVQSFFVIEPLGQAWGSRLTVGVLTPAYLLEHTHTYFLLSSHISPAITVVYLICFLIYLLAKKSLQHSVITTTIIIILSH